MSADELAQKAMIALNQGQPEQARELLQQAIGEADRPRPDLLQGLAVVQLQLGQSEQAQDHLVKAIELGWKHGAPPEFLAHATLALAAAHEDQDSPSQALEVYEQLYEIDVAHSGRAQHAHLLLAMGRVDEGLAQLARYAELTRDGPEYVEAVQALIASVRGWIASCRSPRDFLLAHRESYVEFFDEKAAEMEAQGWMAEPARMMRAPDGEIVPLIPEGAAPYAAVRVDLVAPDGQAGQMGDQPMVVAVSGFEPLARAPLLLPVEGTPFPLSVSSQTPWDQLPIHVLLHSGDAVALLEPVIADWYTEGFNGRFGSATGGRFHYISDLEPKRGGRGITFHVDMGRASLLAVEDLLDRLEVLHRVHGVQQVVLGRGHLSED
jgi:tetratricopeptide (TPR) repeat protein